MAHSPISMVNQTGKTARAPLETGKRSAAGKTQASFAAVMDNERKGQATSDSQKAGKAGVDNNTKGVSRSSRPTVAAREGSVSVRGNLAGRVPSDLIRMQTFNKASADLTRTRALDSVAQGMTGSSTLDVARNMGAAANLRTIAANGNGRGFALASTDFIHTSPRSQRAAKGQRGRQRAAIQDPGIGKLSAQFESGSDGIAAVGYDGTGGTSYGKYQIASKVGSMKSFLAFLDNAAPDLSKRLRQAGPANTGSRRGAMPDTWRAIAKEQPERFEQLQESYIRESHYQPALDAIGQRTGIDPANLSPAMREVIWSTAVQHGPAGAARIFQRADGMSGKSTDAGYERKMITNVYNVRAGQFGSSTSQVREAVRNRFQQERQLALKMLEGNTRANMA